MPFLGSNFLKGVIESLLEE